jgi:ABC-type polar amino acid transport system ATPase subunit
VVDFLEVRDVAKSFGDLRVLEGVSLSVQPGEIVMLIGPSGCGKSTLLRCINGLLPVDSGTITMKGRSTQGKSREVRQARRPIGTVFQHLNVFPHLTVLENIANPLRVVRGLGKEEAAARAAEHLARVQLTDKVSSYPASLSGGQKQRVAIARALAMEPEIMLFDEPTSALDPEIAHEVLDTIRELASEGLAMIIATHQVNFIGSFAQRVIFLAEGRIVVDGGPEQVLLETDQPQLNRFLKRLRDST